MPNDAICVVENLKSLMDKYVEMYQEYERLPQFESLVRSVRGNGMFFQYSQSERDAIVAKANENRKKLKKGIFEKALQENPEFINTLLSAINDAKMYVANTETIVENGITAMIYWLENTYLPE